MAKGRRGLRLLQQRLGGLRAAKRALARRAPERLTRPRRAREGAAAADYSRLAPSPCGPSRRRVTRVGRLTGAQYPPPPPPPPELAMIAITMIAATRATTPMTIHALRLSVIASSPFLWKASELRSLISSCR